MSDVNEVQDDGAKMPTSFELLKQKADKLGVSYSPNIGEKTLLVRVRAATDPKPQVDSEQVEEEEELPTKVKAGAKEPLKPMSFYKAEEDDNAKNQRLRKEANKLVRINASCMNPNKKSMTGEYFSISNAAIGTIKKFVQFNTADGFHVPKVIADHLASRKCQIFIPGVNKKGKKIMMSKMINEFSVTIMAPLTSNELTELAARQALAGSID